MNLDVITQIRSELHAKSLPFVFIGFLCGVLIIIDPHLDPNGGVYAYLKYAQIQIDLSEHAHSIINEHMAFISILYLVVILMFISAIHRSVLGCNVNSWFYLKVIKPMDDFLLSLNGAVLGLLIGVAIVAMFEAICLEGSYRHAIGFILFCFIPYVFSFVVCWSREIVSNRFFIGKYLLGKCGDMLEGAILLLLAFMLLTFHAQFIEFIHSIPDVISDFFIWLCNKIRDFNL
ncbi:hypothetical protein [Vibrio antiquarius]|uniref:hypothetical protein n=1 Tax=Vibrio antiquarius (strain Ex25) TaxID=150340 RepID=UPI002659BB02|nr:hypothetical protein [Vibrio antiquarius]MCE9846294.1 hypothetical protein [Vibrio antiquarius]